ncbi:MAG: asparagine synthase (glutamine-hydrolyzing) [Clostridia bacterium]|nr:asparagine synthase (glutamine-hydrolyzing) [Clostridia bacterium]
MCGFIGFTDERTAEEKKIIAKKMADRIIHRGPDSEGYFTDDKVALGFRRLSIVDLAGGDQPIFNEDKSKVIVFNGEIYNHKELRADLEKKGHIFKTNADTEAILHGFEEYGVNLFPMLRGMFAFVIYDKATGSLTGARDPFGIKPFYYYKKDNKFMFGSEIKGFLDHPDFEKEVNKKALKMYLVFQYSVFEETFFKNVYKLTPGHYFTYNNGKFETKPYFEVKYEKEEKSYEEYKTLIKDALENSVKYHQITADVEVGSYLSGGVDSSYVVSVAKPDKTFTVGFDVKGFDETKMAHDFSALMGINNYGKYISKEEFFEALPRVQYHTDEPEANLSAVPLLFLSKLAREKVKVVLSGEGSDEMFGGYNEYPETVGVKLYLLFPEFIRKGMAAIAKKLPHFPGKNTIIKYSKPFCERYLGHAQIMDEDEANQILCDELKDNMTTTEVLAPYYEKVKDKDDVLKKMYIDMHFWLPQDILLKADKMTMANSIELRVPFLDKEVWKVASKVPTKYLVKGKKTKVIFRDIADDKMPAEWSGRRKLGFPVPFSKWIREEKYYKLLKAEFEKPCVSLFFNKEFINKLLDDHYEEKANNGRKLYNIYTFLIWYNVYFGENVNG